MSVIRSLCVLFCIIVFASGGAAVDDSPGQPGEWGFRPAEGQPSAVNPPGFVWRPQKGAVSYEIEVAREKAFEPAAYRASVPAYPCHCPPKTFPKGLWFWRFRFVDGKGIQSAWSKVRSFIIDDGAIEFPLPARADLIARIPKTHPRLFVRPEQLADLRARAKTDLKPQYDALLAESKKIARRLPPTAEPPLYPKGMKRGSDPWRKMWWGNRTYAQRVLNGAAILAFTRLLDGNEEYGRIAKRLLLDAAKWDPKGATGYRYNDEAGMPYAYYFARTYTFLHDLLSEQERAACRKVMAVRGEEMYRHLASRHIWRPYSSHSNRAWHFLGEVGIAFLGEIPEAEEWVWFAMNVFANAYPVWSDADGGWHEGAGYWSSYIGRFTWWADVMRAAVGVDAYQKPYFSKVGYYPMYLQPPGTKGGGFGDLNARRTSSSNREIMSVLAAQARNPYWQWYVDAVGGPRQTGNYIGFVRGSLPKVESKPPAPLPSSRCFRGTGLAMLNVTLENARDNVSVLFKSSPFGTQSHGYESNNAFLLYAYGERLLIRTGRRDSYGSEHHRKWMWTTRSTNCITVDGGGQPGHSSSAQGKIVAFHTSPHVDYVAGEAGGAYGKALDRFTRHVVFVKPDLIVLYDQLEAPKPSTFTWWLHSPTKMDVKGQSDVRVKNGNAACRVSFLAPAKLDISLTDKFDPPPRPRVKLVEWHLTATTKLTKRMEFVTVLQPHRADAFAPAPAKLRATDGRHVVTAGDSTIELAWDRPITVTRRGRAMTLPAVER